MPACVLCEIVREGEPGLHDRRSRCCRRAYLLGMDPLMGKVHNHRRQGSLNDCNCWSPASPGSCRRLAPLTLQADQLGDVPSEGGLRASDKGLLLISLDEYLRLLDWCGREVRGEKRRAIPADLPPILEQLGVVEEELIETVREFPRCFRRLAGSVSHFTARACRSAAAGSTVCVARHASFADPRVAAG